MTTARSGRHLRCFLTSQKTIGCNSRKRTTKDGSTPKEVTTGQLSHIAVKCLMKIMYIARFARQDLLAAARALTTMITKWGEMRDRKLFRIIKYMNGSAEWRQIGFIGDTPDELELELFSDADFVGDRADMRSTSGVFLALYGTHSFFPLMGQSKEQTAVSHSTVEAETVAADHAIRTSGIPALQLWENYVIDGTSTALLG